MLGYGEIYPKIWDMIDKCPILVKRTCQSAVGVLIFMYQLNNQQPNQGV